MNIIEVYDYLRLHGIITTTYDLLSKFPASKGFTIFARPSQWYDVTIEHTKENAIRIHSSNHVGDWVIIHNEEELKEWAKKRCTEFKELN